MQGNYGPNSKHTDKGPHSQGDDIPSESWTIKKAECQRIDAFELWCWRRLLKVSGKQEDQTSQPQGKSNLSTHWKD